MPPKKRARGGRSGAAAAPVATPKSHLEGAGQQARRRSLRASLGTTAAATTGKRSAYFEHDELGDEEEEDEDEETQAPPRKKQSQAQGRGRGAAKATPGRRGHVEEESDEYDGEQAGEEEDEESGSTYEDSTPPPPPPKDTPTPKRGRGRPSKSAQPSPSANKRQSTGAGPRSRSAKSRAKNPVEETDYAGEGEYDDEENYDDDDDDEDEDERGVTFIPLPELRDTGGVEYVDTRLHPNTLLFLKDLKANNNRNWLKSECFLNKVWCPIFSFVFSAMSSHAGICVRLEK